MKPDNNSCLPDLDLKKLNIQPDDNLISKLLMLIEGTYGLGVKHSIQKYNYTEQAYYQIKKNFMENGSQGLIDQKRGPKQKRVLKENVVKQVIRMKFLDTFSNARVIAQKLNQNGIKISVRSVERVIQQYGLTKKNFTG
jgi:transposase